MANEGPTMTADRPFAGKSAVVTGGAAGIGLAVARRFARAGARVGLMDRDAAALERAAAALAGEGATFHAQACDVTDAAAVRGAIARLEAALGGIDLLVNNAGITHRSAAADTDPAVLRKVMDVNFFGAVHCTQAALASLTARRGGIVAISSVAGFAPLAFRAGYVASKHAMQGYFDTLRAELEPLGVAVTIVCPTFTETGFDTRAMGADAASRPAMPWNPLGRVARPEEVADSVYEAAAARRPLAVLSPIGKASWWLSRVAPRAYAWAMRRAMGRGVEAARVDSRGASW
jgi:NAD(P)-dependent dehydrogenase (short-subunit alcohol dehydrogenase family)